MRNNLNTARRHIAQLRQALLSPTPEGIEGCLAGLAEAAICLGEIERALRAQPAEPGLAAELKTLKLDLKMIGRMIEHGARFYRGWASVLGVAAGGYLATGQAAQIPVRGSIAVEG